MLLLDQVSSSEPERYFMLLDMMELSVISTIVATYGEHLT